MKNFLDISTGKLVEKLEEVEVKHKHGEELALIIDGNRHKFTGGFQYYE